MVSRKNENDKNRIRVAESELSRIEETLKLLARGATITNIAAQVRYSEKWVRDLKKKALAYPVSKVMTLPPEVQVYLMEKRTGLKEELEEFRRSTGQTPPGGQVSAIELATFKHREELISLAANLVSLREQYDEGHPIGGYYGYIIDDPLMIELSHGLINCLISHMKFEFPEYQKISEWKDLLKIDTSEDVIMKLAFVAHRKTLEGTCPICRHEK